MTIHRERRQRPCDRSKWPWFLIIINCVFCFISFPRTEQMRSCSWVNCTKNHFQMFLISREKQSFINLLSSPTCQKNISDKGTIQRRKFSIQKGVGVIYHLSFIHFLASENLQKYKEAFGIFKMFPFNPFHSLLTKKNLP